MRNAVPRIQRQGSFSGSLNGVKPASFGRVHKSLRYFLGGDLSIICRDLSCLRCKTFKVWASPRKDVFDTEVEFRTTIRASMAEVRLYQLAQ